MIVPLSYTLVTLFLLIYGSKKFGIWYLIVKIWNKVDDKLEQIFEREANEKDCNKWEIKK